MYVCHDTAEGGFWHVCSKCDFSGDGVSLLSRWADRPPAEAVQAYAATQPTFSLSALRPDVYDAWAATERRREAVNLFWQRARGFEGGDRVAVRAACRAVGLTASPFEWRRELMSDMFGSASHASYNRDVVRGGYALPAGRSLTADMGRRPVAGKLNDTAVVVPAYDLPGRICGFFWLSMIDANLWACYRPITASGGFIGASLLANVRGKQSVLVVPDPGLALRLQLAQLQSDGVPLNVIGACGGVGDGAKHMLRGRKFVVAVGDDSTAAIEAARALDASVVDYSDWGDMAKPSRTPLPLMVKAAIAAAKPWPRRVDEAVQSGTSAQVRVLTHSLRLTPTSLLSEESNARIVEATAGVAANAVYLDGRVVTEQLDGLYVTNANNSAMLQNFRLRIDAIGCGDDASEVYARCRVLIGDAESHYTCKLSNFVNASIAEASRALARLSKTAYVARNAKIYMLRAAQAFSKPRHVTMRETVGWHASDGAIALPTLTLPKGGGVTMDNQFAQPAKHKHGRIANVRLTQEHVRWLSQPKPVTRLCWLAIRDVAVNTARVISGQSAVGTVIIGDSSATRQVYAAIGALELRNYYEQSGQKANWPTITLSTSANRQLAGLANNYPWLTAVTTTLPGAMLALNPHWSLRVSSSTADLSSDERLAVQAALVDFLSYLQGRNPQVLRDFHKTTDAELRRWWQLRGGAFPGICKRLPRNSLARLAVATAQQLIPLRNWTTQRCGRTLIELDKLHRWLGCRTPLCTAARFAANLKAGGTAASINTRVSDGVIVTTKAFQAIARRHNQTKSASLQSSSKSD